MHTIIAENKGTIMKTQKFQALAPEFLLCFVIYRRLVSIQLEELLEKRVLSFYKITLLLIVAFYHEMKYLEPCYTSSIPSNMKIVKNNYFYIASLSFIDVFPRKEKCL